MSMVNRTLLIGMLLTAVVAGLAATAQLGFVLGRKAGLDSAENGFLLTRLSHRAYALNLLNKAPGPAGDNGLVVTRFLAPVLTLSLIHLEGRGGLSNLSKGARDELLQVLHRADGRMVESQVRWAALPVEADALAALSTLIAESSN